MIRLRWLLAACSIAALPATTASAQAESEFQELRAWHAEVGGAKTHISAESLFLESGTIRTPALYADFVLRFEYRPLKADARGELHLRSFFDGHGRIGRGYTVTLDGTARRGHIRGYGEFVPAHRSDKRPRIADGAWVACEVRADGDRITVTMDGAVVTEATRLNDIGGFFGLSGSNGGLELRSLRVAPLGVRLDVFPTGLPTAHAPGVTAPVDVYREPPVYPREPLHLRIEGVVNLEIALDAEGRMTHARVLKTPHPDFLRNAVACARKWRFRPATKDGAPIAVTATLDVEFKLGR